MHLNPLKTSATIRGKKREREERITRLQTALPFVLYSSYLIQPPSLQSLNESSVTVELD
jgi:hypothetical protein